MLASPSLLMCSSIHAILLLFACLTANAIDVQPRKYEQGEKLGVQVDSVTSSEAQLPFQYYSLPFCQAKGGAKARKETLGTKLSGLGRFSSPYELRVNVHEKVKEVCADGSAGPLTLAQVEDVKDKIDKGYRINMATDGMPITTFDLESARSRVIPDLSPGFDLGAKTSDSNGYVIFNHLVFNVLINKAKGADMHAARRHDNAGDVGGARGVSDVMATEARPMWEVVGFELMPCSIKRLKGEPLEDIECRPWGDPRNPSPQVVAEGEDIVYTYDVYWQEVDIKWSRRWDAYLHGPAGVPEIQWFSVLNSLCTVLVLSVMVAIVFLRTVRRDLAKYNILRRVVQGKDPSAEAGWMLVAGDVFREPAAAVQLASLFGGGVHVLCTAAATLMLAAVGLLSPAHRGALLTTAILLYALLSVAGGYSAVLLWRNMARSASQDPSRFSHWGGVCFKAAVELPGVMISAACIYSFVHKVATTYPSFSGAVSPIFAQLLRLDIVWVFIIVPVAFLGGYLASRTPPIVWPGSTNKGPRDIPRPQLLTRPVVLYAVAGLMPFATINIGLYYVMSAMWRGYFFHQFGFLVVVFGLTVLVTIQCSIILTYIQLRGQDYNWWWRSFNRGGATALYLLGYSCIFLKVYIPATASHGLAVLLYGCYMAVVSFAVYLCLGAVGFAASLAFVWLAYSHLEADGVSMNGRAQEDCAEQLLEVSTCRAEGADEDKPGGADEDKPGGDV